MKNLKKIISMLLVLSLALCVCFSLASCGTPNEGDGSGDSGNGNGDGKVDYTVTVISADGAALSGVKVQLLLDGIVEMGTAQVTGSDGKASFRLKEGNYSAKIVSVPEGGNYILPTAVFALENNAATVVIESLSTYTIYVKDSNGAPVANVWVQLCSDAGCRLPEVTDAEGKVVFNFAADSYKAQLSSTPLGYKENTQKYELVNNTATIIIEAE